MQAAAQSVSGPFAGSVPSGAVTAAALPLSLNGALERGLEHNLGVITLEEQVESARGTRIRMLRELMPRLDARVDDAAQTRNLAAFGFNASAIPGFSFPAVVGPFNVFDARLYASQTVFDATARHDVRSSEFSLSAAQLESRNAHDVVSFVVTNLYFQAVAGVHRIETARAQVATADSLLQLATSQRNAGVTPGIDVVRAQVQLQAQRQRFIAAENEYAKLTLQLARAIGLPVAQRVELTDREVNVPLPTLTLDEALTRAGAVAPRLSGGGRARARRRGVAESGAGGSAADRPRERGRRDHRVESSERTRHLRRRRLGAAVGVRHRPQGARGRERGTTAAAAGRSGGFRPAD